MVIILINMVKNLLLNNFLIHEQLNTSKIEKNNTYKPGLAFGTTYRTMSFTASNIKIDNAIFVNNQSIASADNNNIIVTDIYGIV